MRIEKRLPFGFRGDWGKLYKRYTADEEVEIDDSVIEYQQNYYVDIGMPVQFKKILEETDNIEQLVQGLITEVRDVTVETTDAYWNDARKEYMCVISPGDIVRVFGQQWMVTSIKTVSRYSPAEHKFFYCELTRTL